MPRARIEEERSREKLVSTEEEEEWIEERLRKLGYPIGSNVEVRVKMMNQVLVNAHWQIFSF